MVDARVKQLVQRRRGNQLVRADGTTHVAGTGWKGADGRVHVIPVHIRVRTRSEQMSRPVVSSPYEAGMKPWSGTEWICGARRARIAQGQAGRKAHAHRRAGLSSPWTPAARARASSASPRRYRGCHPQECCMNMRPRRQDVQGASTCSCRHLLPASRTEHRLYNYPWFVFHMALRGTPKASSSPLASGRAMTATLEILPGSGSLGSRHRRLLYQHMRLWMSAIWKHTSEEVPKVVTLGHICRQLTIRRSCSGISPEGKKHLHHAGLAEGCSDVEWSEPRVVTLADVRAVLHSRAHILHTVGSDALQEALLHPLQVFLSTAWHVCGLDGLRLRRWL
mmetsp:Transcript_15608/g.47682  ORF Transcript_15608/g.47682 Transcript_15608/m.47682 type:complete len:336 (-) Transcript_15608:453-1460(-)